MSAMHKLKPEIEFLSTFLSELNFNDTICNIQGWVERNFDLEENTLHYAAQAVRNVFERGIVRDGRLNLGAAL